MEYQFFSRLKDIGSEGYHVKPFLLAQEFGIETRHVREMLVKWANERLVSLEVWATGGFRPFSDWEKTDGFFEYGNEVGHVRVTLLAAGDEYLEHLKEVEHRPIGFQAEGDKPR
jgi:hypothetical protein